ncbi:hypothetical protein FQZ97_1198820 [compost metagenome]
MVFDLAQGRYRQRTVLQYIADQLQDFKLAGGDARVEALGANQLTQGEVAFQAGARRADTDHLAVLQQGSGLVEG